MKNLANKITSFFKQTIFAKRGKHAKFHLPLQAYLSYLLFACILLTGYSFASYATSSELSDEDARVADYGVSIVIDTEAMNNAAAVENSVPTNLYEDYRFRGTFINTGGQQNTHDWIYYGRDADLQEDTATEVMNFKVQNNSEVTVFCKTFKFTMQGTEFPEETTFTLCGNEPTSTEVVDGNTVLTFETESLVDANGLSLATPIDPRTASTQFYYDVHVPLVYGDSLQPGYTNVYFRHRLLDDVTLHLLNVEVQTQQYIPNP